jgi:hypothetical protein
MTSDLALTRERCDGSVSGEAVQVCDGNLQASQLESTTSQLQFSILCGWSFQLQRFPVDRRDCSDSWPPELTSFVMRDPSPPAHTPARGDRLRSAARFRPGAPPGLQTPATKTRFVAGGRNFCGWSFQLQRFPVDRRDCSDSWPPELTSFVMRDPSPPAHPPARGDRLRLVERRTAATKAYDRCFTCLASAMKIVSSAMLVARSATRSRFFATEISSMPREIDVGSSAM